ncbi:MAG: hypothetical protein Q8P02_01845, partial [Candidatus Micrarchaeota archaeon]|nr:hypothetical protein [Candidatus Micrarchaeota archaeon]
NRPHAVALSSADLSKGTLKKQSIVRADYPLVAEKNIIQTKIASVTPAFLARVKKEIGTLYQLNTGK